MMLYPRFSRNAFVYLSNCLLLLGCSPQSGVADKGAVTLGVMQEAQQPTVPILVLVGEIDSGPGRSTISVAEAKDLFPHAKIIVLKDAGYMPNMEAPEAFTREVTSSLATVK